MQAEELLHQNAILQVIVNISQQLFVAAPFEEKLAQSLASLGAALDVTHVYILQNEQTENGRFLSHRCEWSQQRSTILLDPEFQQVAYAQLGWSRWESLLAQGQLIHGPISEFPPAEQLFFRQRGMLSILVAPIKQGDQWWGVLVLGDCHTSRVWRQYEIEAISGLGGVLGAAFATQQAYLMERKARGRLGVLRELAQTIHGSLLREEVLAQSLEQLRHLITFDTASIYLLPQEGRPASLSGIGFKDKARTIQEAIPVLARSPTIQRMMTDLRPLLVADVRQHPDWIWITGAEHVRAFMMVPLVIQGRMIGVFMLDSSQAGFFTPLDLQMAQFLAQHIAVAVGNAWLYEEKEHQLQLTRVLQRVGALLTTGIGLGGLYQQLLDLLAEVIAYDSASLQLLTPDNKGFNLVAGRGFDNLQQAGEIVQQLSIHILKKLPVPPYWQVIPDTHADPRWQILPGSEKIRSWIGAALLVKGRLIGVLNVDSHTVNAYNARMGEMVAAFANQAAVAIERAQLYERLQIQADGLVQQVAQRVAELQAERDRTLAILESMGESVIVTDTQPRILYVNPAMERQSGYTRAEVLGKNPNILRSPLTPTAVYEQMWQAILAGRSWSGELVNKRKDGSLYDLAVTIAPIKSPDGTITNFVSVQSDISRFKELDRLKSQFVSNVSHELRTPLTNIKLYLTLLARGNAQRHAHYLQVLDHEVERLAVLVQDLLDLSRLETEPLDTSIVWTNLQQVLPGVLQTLAQKAMHKQIALQTDLPPLLPDVQISAYHLGQLLFNLLENALLYTQEGGIVTLSANTLPDIKKPMLMLVVADNGPGISPQDMPYIFDRFYRGEPAKDGNLTGTGLGLTICQEIVRRYQGKIDVDSQPGAGSTFTVWLRAAG